MADGVALVTGGSDGIGLAVARRLLQRGMRVVIVGRNRDKGERAIASLHQQVSGCEVFFWQSNLARMADVMTLAERFKAHSDQLDRLVHCAGVMLRERVLTDEGLETVFAVQYVARYALTYALLDRLRAADAARVVNVSAGGSFHLKLDWDNLNGEKSYDSVKALRHESVANDMLTLDLQQMQGNAGRFYCYGPGYVSTGLLRDMPAWFRGFAKVVGRFIGISADQAADDVLRLLTDDLDGGLYGRAAKRNTPSDFCADVANRYRLRQITDALIEDALARNTPT